MYLAIGYAMCMTFAALALAPLPSEPGTGVIDKIGHWLAFFALMLWFTGASDDSQGGRLFIQLAVFGVVIEILQAIGGYRSAEWLDVMFNLAGALAAWGIAEVGAFGWGRRLVAVTGRKWSPN